MKRAFLGLLSPLLLLANPAWAADDEAEPSEEKPSEAKPSEEAEQKPAVEDEDFGHMGQFGLRAALLGGYRMVFRYDSSPYCREPDPAKGLKDQQKFCGHVAPIASDLALSFGLLDMLEPYFWVRLGFTGEEETDTDPLKILGVGVRLYTMSDSAFKIFVEPAIAYEFEGGGDKAVTGLPAVGYDPEYKKDLIFHLAAGPHWDFHKNFGAYVHGGLTTGVVRAIHSELELAFGIQGRAP